MSDDGKVVSPFPAEHPNQLLHELLEQHKQINALVVVARDHAGRLYVSWTDQDPAALSEAAQLLNATTAIHVYGEHSTALEEDEAPGLELSFLANDDQEEYEE